MKEFIDLIKSILRLLLHTSAIVSMISGYYFWLHDGDFQKTVVAFLITIISLQYAKDD